MTIYTVEGHRLLANGIAVPFRGSPNIGGRVTAHRLLVHHYTSGAFDGAVSWLCDPAAKASAHLVVGEAGEIIQLIPFDRVAWHAGRSSWRDVEGSVNGVSIGIEIANYGDLSGSPGHWRTETGRAISDDRVLVARHKAGGTARPWHTYPAAQIAAVIAISRALHAAYRFEELVGHEDVAPGRKVDPGPAYPMEMVRAQVMSRSAPAAVLPPASTPIVAAAPAPTIVETPKDVQRALNALGYGPLDVDGDIGPASEAAVRRFQLVAGLDTDGDPGPKTRAALAAAMARH